MSYIDLTGKRFGRWTVIGPAEDKVLPSGYVEKMWECVCDCGSVRTVRGKSLRGGISKSCGCLQRELMGDRTRKHGGFGTRLYAVWNSMRQRCNNKQHYAYHNYGGRGISICDEWNDFDVFRAWALSSGYREDADRGELTLDRIDVDGPYAPENCRWADMKDQADNRRSSILVTYHGETKPLVVFAKELGIGYTTAWKRYKNGASIEEVLRK